MEVRIIDMDKESAGEIALETTLSLDEVVTLREQAVRALEIERALPFDMRSELAGNESAYIRNFFETRIAGDTMETYGIIPATVPTAQSNAGAVSDEPFTCRVNVLPRPEAALTSFEPIDLSKNRIPKAGFSLEAARAGQTDGIDFVEDTKALRAIMGERLVTHIPQAVEAAYVEEYQKGFERRLELNGMSVDVYRTNSGLDEEQYSAFISAQAMSEARWNLALDTVFDSVGLSVTDEDLLAEYERVAPGYSEELLELHELHNDTYRAIMRIRHQKAHDYLTDTAIK